MCAEYIFIVKVPFTPSLLYAFVLSHCLLSDVSGIFYSNF